MEKHHGPLRSLDFNPFKPALLTSGGADGEIYIWDVSKPPQPMSPGTRPGPAADISCVAWNRQVAHILASASMDGMSTVWDLRATRPVIQFSDPTTKCRCKSIEWHPGVATMVRRGGAGQLRVRWRASS